MTVGLFQVVVPPGTDVTQLITNPSAEKGTTGYTAGAGSLSKSATQQRRGVYSLKYLPSAATTDGFYYAIALTSGVTYYLSCDFFGVDMIPYEVCFATVGGVMQGTHAVFSGGGYWQADRPVAAFTPGSTTTYRLYFRKNTSTSTQAFYVDGVMLQTIDPALIYFDGDTPGAYWTGTPHASRSIMSGESREGGVLTDITADYNVNVKGWAGLGMPALKNITPEYGLIDGGFFQRTKAGLRQVILSVLLGDDNTADLNSLHLVRKNIENALKPDAVSPQQAVWWRYGCGSRPTDLLKPVWFKGIYDGGLEMNYEPKARFVESASIRLTCPDPYLYEEGNAGRSLIYQQSIDANGIVKRSTSGAYSGMGLGVDPIDGGRVQAIAFGLDGKVYVGGTFLLMGGISNTQFIAVWDPITLTWSEMAGGGSGGSHVTSITVGPDGSIYVAGDFADMGSVPNTKGIARWDGFAWHALGTGVDGATGINAMVMDQGVNLYVTGTFLTINGVPNTHFIAKWNGSAWSALTTGLNDEGFALAVDSNGNLFVGGLFTLAGGVMNTAYIAMWNGSAWIALGTGASNTVYALTISPSGFLVAGGAFEVMGGIINTSHVAIWNGTSWVSLSTQAINSDVRALAYDGSGVLHIGGFFTTPYHNPIVWNGSSFAQEDIVLNSVSYDVYAFGFGQDGTFYYGFDTVGSATAAVVTSVTNAGMAIAHHGLKIDFVGPGTPIQIKNYTTGDAISLNLVLNVGETATLTINPTGVAFESTFRGNILSTILPGSNEDTFKLMPGDNLISVFVIGAVDGNTAVQIQWATSHWSADGGAS